MTWFWTLCVGGGGGGVRGSEMVVLDFVGGWGTLFWLVLGVDSRGGEGSSRRGVLTV